MTPSLIVTFSCFTAKIVSFLFLPNREGKELIPAGGNGTSYVRTFLEVITLLFYSSETDQNCHFKFFLVFRSHCYILPDFYKPSSLPTQVQIIFQKRFNSANYKKMA